MAKLYWRIKRDGKWTWVAATPENTKYSQGFPLKYIGLGLASHGSYHDEKPVDKPEVYTDE